MSRIPTSTVDVEVRSPTGDGRLPSGTLVRAAEALAWWAGRGGGDTSSVLGTGAIAELEMLGAARLGHQFGLALPSATMALRVALDAVGVGPGDHVLVPAVDWGAARAAVASLGAVALVVDVTTPTGAIDPVDAARRCTEGTRAVVVTHLFGVPADTAAVRAALPSSVAVVEDCAQALGAGPPGRPVGSDGDIAVCSFGPGKIVDAGEGGLLACSDRTLMDEAIRPSQHPAGQVARGIEVPDTVNFSARIHPAAAVMACRGLIDLDVCLAERRALRTLLATRLATFAGLSFDDRIVEQAGGTTIPVLATGPLGLIDRSGSGIDLRPLTTTLDLPSDEMSGTLAENLQSAFLASLGRTFSG